VSPEEWIAALGGVAAEARSKAGHADIHLQVGYHAVRIRIAPESMRSLLQPLAGLTDSGENGHNGRTIELWDVAACGVRPPSLPPEALTDGRGEIRWLVSPTTTGAWQESGPMLLAWDAEAEVVSGWIGASARLPAWERAAPLRVALNWALRGSRRALAHAAAVGRAGDGAGLLIVGPGGSGKSTTALSWLLAGGDFAGDDYVLVDLDGGGGPVAGAIYATAKADATAIDLLPELASSAAVGVDEYAGKSILDVRTLRPGQPASALPIAAVIVPRVAGGTRAEVRPVSAGAALKALAPSSMLQLPGEAGGLAVLAALVRDLPCFEMELASDPGANVDALDGILSA
jgi:hypothetical protein